MKALLISLVALCSVTSAFARIVTLDSSTRVFREDRRGDLTEVVTFSAGTTMDISNRVFRVPGIGSAFKVREVFNMESFRSNHRYNTAIDIKRSRGYIDYFVSSRAIEGRRNGETRRTRVNPRISERRVETYDYAYEYEMCYERPKTYVSEVTDVKKDRNGRRNSWIGIGLGLGGQIFGEVTGNRDAGNVISGVGAGFLIVGMMQVASANEVFVVDNGMDCRSYYTVDTYEHEFYRMERGRRTRCVTNRYYTTRWNGTSEYFETTCYGSTRSSYVSFNRSDRYWR